MSADTLVVALGWVAAVISCFISAPQLLRIMRSGSVAGVSRTAWQLSLGANITWGVHGVLHGNPNQWAPNILLITVTCLILKLLREVDHTPWWRMVAPGLAIPALAISLELGVNIVAFSIAIFTPAAVSLVMQIRSTLASEDVTGVSLAYQWLGLVNQSVWLVWGLLVGERSVILCGSAAMVLLVTNLASGTLRKSGRLGPVSMRRLRAAA